MTVQPEVYFSLGLWQYPPTWISYADISKAYATEYNEWQTLQSNAVVVQLANWSCFVAVNLQFYK